MQTASAITRDGRRAFFITLLALVALVPEANAATPSDDTRVEAKILIWGGGKTKEAAESFLEDWNAFDELFEKSESDIPKGYPRIIESKTYQDLNAGFWIVVVGVCKSADGDKQLRALRRLHPGTYARTIHVSPRAIACPTTPEVTPVESPARQGAFRLAAFTAPLLAEEIQDPPYTGQFRSAGSATAYLFILTDGKKRIRSALLTAGDEKFEGNPYEGRPPFSCTSELIAGAGRFEVIRKCDAAFGECGSVTAATESTVVTIDAPHAEIEVREKRTPTEGVECDQP